jgi:hypothetical protein
MGFSARVWAGGWYLMGAPSGADVDPSCAADGWPELIDYLAALRHREPVSDARAFRCIREFLMDVPNTPLSQWVPIETPKVNGVPGEYVSAFEKLEDCETADYLARYTDVSRRSAGTRAWLATLLEKRLALSYDKDPALKGIDLNDETKLRQALEHFAHEHPDDDRARTYEALMRAKLLSGSDEPARRALACVASDDPRLAR